MKYIFYFFVFAFLLISCSKNEDSEPLLFISEQRPVVDKNTTTYYIDIETDSKWEIYDISWTQNSTKEEIWCQISKKEGTGGKSQIILTMTKNNFYSWREMTAYISTESGLKNSFSILQSGDRFEQGEFAKITNSTLYAKRYFGSNGAFADSGYVFNEYLSEGGIIKYVGNRNKSEYRLFRFSTSYKLLGYVCELFYQNNNEGYELMKDKFADPFYIIMVGNPTINSFYSYISNTNKGTFSTSKSGDYITFNFDKFRTGTSSWMFELTGTLVIQILPKAEIG